MNPTYEVADATEWLADRVVDGAIITGPPDAAEIPGMTPDEYPAWLQHAAHLTIHATHPDAPTIFAVTDRKHDGGIISKASVIMRAAADTGTRLIWHKIILRRDAGKHDLFRPTYTHLLAVARSGIAGPGTPDVIPPSRSLYANGISVAATTTAVTFAQRHTDHVTDPFCGRGTIPAIAAAYGMTAVGIDIDPQQIARAKRLRVQPRRTE